MATAGILDLQAAKAFKPLLARSRYKAAYGGRGSGKSHFFAELAIARAAAASGLRIVCVREVQKSLKDSVKLLLEDKIGTLGVGRQFGIFDKEIRAPGNGLIVFQGMQDHTAESVKSLEGFDIAYVEEAQSLTARSLEMLRPTIRKSGSELWFSWNPRHKRDPVDAFFRARTPPENAIIVRANYDTNPFFPAELEQERLDDLANKPDRYAHIWLGDYEPAAIGAYYAREMAKMLADGRIRSVPHYPGVKVETWWDLGATKEGRTMCVGFVQRIGHELHCIDYLESGGPDQGLPHFAMQLQVKQQNHGYVYGDHVWPHDGGRMQLATGETLDQTFKKLGFTATVLPMPSDTGHGIDQVRNMLARMFFDEKKTEPWVDALKNYRPEWDEDHMIFKPKPLHDWSSHAADMTRVGAEHVPNDWGGKDRMIKRKAVI